MRTTLRTAAHSGDPQLTAAQLHLAEHGDALISAAELVGGAERGRRVLRLIGDLRKARRLTLGAKVELVALHRLLSLDPLGMAEDDDLGFDFSLMLDPDGIEVEEICLQTDALFDLLQALASMEEDRGIMAEALARQDAA
ncbi:hypothetical protein [Salipiger mangrovisoli]|uniref:Uncharacterized protein n=1 Tax=Salipiger mangrovisoli TaxID=2865933 RepID=A0ABR9XBC1_9RHOB|nr:hypothetical protein [Salipiger mangrovisoli]MBE9640926.1 hypothetical protein [Salipiger mangrovisoli]